MNILDLNGFTLSGKAAFTDLIREFDGFNVPNNEFEFCLFRIKDGLIDLRHALVNDWSPVRSDSAIRRFKKLNRIFSSRIPKYSLLWAASPSGYNYDKLINPDFFSITESYINELIVDSFSCDWPFAFHDIDSLDCLKRRGLIRLGLSKYNLFTRYIATGDNFSKKTKAYIDSLLACKLRSGDHTVVFNNAFEPFRAHEISDFCNNAKSIVISRDPRDVYVAGIGVEFSASSNVDLFIKQFKLMRESYAKNPNVDNVLSLKFEDLILNYDDTVSEIINFLSVDKQSHKNKMKFFNPNKSKQNIGLWKKHSNKADIDKIYLALNEYCYE